MHRTTRSLAVPLPFLAALLGPPHLRVPGHSGAHEARKWVDAKGKVLAGTHSRHTGASQRNLTSASADAPTEFGRR
jgi:hypothetical protein